MSSQIPTSYVDSFSANVFHLSQQKGSRLQPSVRNEHQNSESAFWDRIGSVVAQLKTSRHSDTPQLDTPHSRRRVTLDDYIYADLVDDEDLRRTLNDPTNDYALAAVWALGRSKDDVMITAALGTAFGGQKGGTSVTFPNAQKLAAVSGGAGSNMNVQVLRRAKKVLDEGEVDPDIPRFIVMEASQFESLLSETEIASADFNSVRALVQGEIDTFMGFNFMRSQRLNLQSGTLNFNNTTGAVGSGSGDADGYRRAFAWAMDGLLLSTSREINVRIDERADKSYATQVFASMGIGATRMEEEKVVEILANES